MSPATVTVTCSWCHEPVLLGGGPARCPACGHDAGRPRLDCTCPACTRHDPARAGRDDD